jgi:hypothetical protein
MYSFHTSTLWVLAHYCNENHFLLWALLFSTGQVLQHINLGDYVERTVPSLKDLQKEISGGSDLGALSLLRFTMQILQRWITIAQQPLLKAEHIDVGVQQGPFFVVLLCYRFSVFSLDPFTVQVGVQGKP